MSNQTSSIEWTDATWNPLVGCSRVSQGCVHCYAETMAARIANAAQEAQRSGKKLTDIQKAYREVVRWENGGKFPADMYDKALPKWNNEIRLLPSVLTDPLKWKKPRQVFVNSMTDLFHEKVPFDFIDKVFAVMALTPQHTYQVLTKRPERMAEYLAEMNIDGNPTHDGIWSGFSVEPETLAVGMSSGHEFANWTRRPWPLPNVWLGTSVEDQKAADERIPHLLRCPAAVRFLSCEPLIGDVSLQAEWLTSKLGKYPFPYLEREHRTRYIHLLDWVICGGESGPGARPMHPQWARSLRDQCVTAGVPFFFKQWGNWLPDFTTEGGVGECFAKRRILHPDGLDGLVWLHSTPEGSVWMDNVGKKAAGRILDGRTWDEFPEVSGS